MSIQAFPFGEFVFGLKKRSKKSGMNIWLGGIWVGKESTSDMNIVVTANGRFTTRSVRRCSNAWRKDVILSILHSPWSKNKADKVPGMLEAPLPVIEEKGDPTEPEPRQPVLLPSGDVDEEAELVFGADDYAPTEASPVGTPTQQSQQQPLVQDELSRLSEDQRRNLLDLPMQTQPESTMEDAPAGEKREAVSEEPRERKSARLDREGSPSSSQLYAPFFAGKVEIQSQQLHDDECWEEDMDCEMVEFDVDEIPTDYKGEQPPEIPPEDLEQLDGEAMKTEVDKLSKLGVVKVLLEEERDPNGKFVDLREVFDWRKRDGQWRRRCRIVARDFKTGLSNEDTFLSHIGIWCHSIFLDVPFDLWMEDHMS